MQSGYPSWVVNALCSICFECSGHKSAVSHSDVGRNIMFREKLWVNIYDNYDVELYVEGYGVLSVKHIIDNIRRYKHEISRENVELTVSDYHYNSDKVTARLANLHRLSSLLDAHCKALNMYHLFGDGVKEVSNG